MPAAAGIQATAVTPTTSNSKADSNSNDCPQQPKCNRCMGSNNRTANTVGKRKSQTSTAEGRPATAEMPDIVEMPTTVLTSAGTQTAQYGCLN
jgi:hypothetical protein